MAIHCSVPEKFWLALLKAIERMDIAADERFKTREARRENYEILEQMLATTFKSKSRQAWLNILEASDVPAVPLYNVAEVLDDPQVKHLGLTEELEHPQAGKMRFVGAPVRFDHLTREKSAPPPLVGEHGGKVLRELGYSDDDITALQNQMITNVAS